ncbi:MFS transporter [Saliphagus infecundisoli]|uniref:MFS transporter n=1 Tax=Saliphagus infecundisoli TaxID=1849069 RepID=A0ABD5QDC6_9EURY|nr:MFS transporter [Saliphagus infecundisoli]
MNENDRTIVGFTMVGHGLVHTYELSIPILMTVWLLEFSVTAATLGAVVTVGYGLFGVGALPGGMLVDRYGSRTLIAACLVGMGISFGLLGLAPGIGGIALALAVWGVAASVYHPAGLALLSNGVTERGAGYAYHGMAGNVGIAGGPLVTALLLLVVDWRIAVAVLAIPSIAGAVIGARLEFDETAAVDGPGNSAPAGDPEGGLAGFLADSRRLFTLAFLTAVVLVTLSGFFYRGVLTFLPDLLGEFLAVEFQPAAIEGSPMAEEFDLGQYLYVALLVVGIGGQYLGGRLTDAIEPDRGLAVVFVVLTAIAILFVPVAGAGSLPLVTASVCLGFVLFALQPLEQATIAKYSPPDSRGLSFGYTYLAIFGVGALGATVVGIVLTYASPMVAFLVLAACSTAAGGLAASLSAGYVPAPSVARKRG